MQTPTTKSMKKSLPLVDIEIEDRLNSLEQHIFRMDHDIQNIINLLEDINDKLRKTQEFSLKIGQAQNRIHEYISHWPFVRVVKNGKDIS
jgi:hypothetical protein